MKKIVTVLVALLLIAMAASAGQFKPVSKGGVKDVYTVVLKPDVARGPKSPGPDLPTVAEVADDLARSFDGQIDEVWEHALHGFVVRMPEPRARAMARDPRVLEVEQDFEISAPVGHCYFGTSWDDSRSLPSNSVSPQLLTCSDPDPLNDSGSGSPACQDNWGLDRIDQRPGARNETYFFDRTGRSAATTVHIYVMDTGIRASHDEFKDLLGNSRVLGGADARINPVDDSPTADTGDCHGHGTHVAGIIAGRTYGVAKDAILHPVRTIGCPNDGDNSKANTIRALDWIAGHASYPAVISWSGGNTNDTTFSLAVQSAVQGVLSSGIILVQSAGNQSPANDPDQPLLLQDACMLSMGGVLPDVIVAGGMDEQEGRWTRRPDQDPEDDIHCPPDCGSNVGPCIDIWAPASHVVSASKAGDSLACRLSGTSMAAPHVTGVVALYLQDHPSATPPQVSAALREDGTWGALQSDSSHTNWIGSSDNVLLFSRQVVDNPPVAQLTVVCSGLYCEGNAGASTDDFPGLTFGFSWIGGTPGSYSSNPVRSHSYSVPGLYTVVVTARDSAGQTDTVSLVIDVHGTTAADTVGVDKSDNESKLRLYHESGSGSPLKAVISGVSGRGIAGDWNGDDVSSTGRYVAATATFYLRNTNTSGGADLTFNFGTAGANWVPIAGDWDNDGIDTVGLYDSSTGTFRLRNSNSTGAADITFSLTGPSPSWIPIAGDWNCDGIDTVGLYDPSTSTFYLRNSNSSGGADLTFVFGTPGAGLLPNAGDWNGDGWDSIGVFDPLTGTHSLRDLNNPGPADHQFIFSTSTTNRPLAGDWDGV